MSEGEARLGSGAMFDAIAGRYDALNRVLSLGIDQRWRKKTVAALGLTEGGRVLDLATGTGDLAILVARSLSDARVTGLDPSSEMLAVAKGKIEAASLGDRVELVLGEAESLPFEDASFDAVTMAFGIRNVPDRPKALDEIARVLRPGGRVAVLELSEPKSGALGAIARFHIHEAMPRIGALVSRAPAYRYLARSIAAFPPAETFGAMLSKAGLDPVAIEPLTFGVCHLYVATRRASS